MIRVRLLRDANTFSIDLKFVTNYLYDNLIYLFHLPAINDDKMNKLFSNDFQIFKLFRMHMTKYCMTVVNIWCKMWNILVVIFWQKKRKQWNGKGRLITNKNGFIQLIAEIINFTKIMLNAHVQILRQFLRYQLSYLSENIIQNFQIRLDF